MNSYPFAPLVVQRYRMRRKRWPRVVAAVLVCLGAAAGLVFWRLA